MVEPVLSNACFCLVVAPVCVCADDSDVCHRAGRGASVLGGTPGVCVCIYIFIKLHITAQPGPVKLILQCYSNGSALCVYVNIVGYVDVDALLRYQYRISYFHTYFE